MSLRLVLGTKPADLEVKTIGAFGLEGIVLFGDYEISMEDFLIAAEYVLTNTNLTSDDPRLQFVKCVQSMHEIPGYSPGTKRLDSSLLPVILKN